jgi:hypothetical protein
LTHERTGPDAALRQQQPIHAAAAKDGSTYDALYMRLAQDEGACYLIEESLHGARTVRCSERMAEMFISTEELQGLVDQTGLAVGHLMMQCVCFEYVYVWSVCVYFDGGAAGLSGPDGPGGGAPDDALRLLLCVFTYTQMHEPDAVRVLLCTYIYPQMHEPAYTHMHVLPCSSHTLIPTSTQKNDRLVKSPEGVKQLAADLAVMCFDKYGAKSSVDAQVTVSQ